MLLKLSRFANLGPMMSPVRTPRYALSDVTQQQQNMADQIHNSVTGFEHSTLLNDETEAFALEPIDVTSVG